MAIDSDKWVAWSAMLVGVTSLAVAVYQARLDRQTQHASVMPYLMIGIMNSGDAGSFVTLANTGIGPALIEEVRIRYKGAETIEDPADFFVKVHPDENRPISIDRIIKGRLIPAGAFNKLIGTEAPEAQGAMIVDLVQLFDLADVPAAWLTLYKATATPKAIIEITYSSVYGDRWRIRSNSLVPEKL
jgi:hypothetical protein